MNSITPVVDGYLERADAGEKLTTEERRTCVAWIVLNEPHVSQATMSRRFRVDESTIRADVHKIKKEFAATVGEDTDIKLIIFDALAARDRVLRNLAKGIKRLEDLNKEHSKEYLLFNREFLNTHMKVTEALQNMGILPKNLGAVTVNKHVFKSYVQPMGAVETRPVDLFDDPRRPTPICRGALRGDAVAFSTRFGCGNRSGTARRPERDDPVAVEDLYGR